MKKAEPNEQLGISTLGFAFADVAHLRGFMHRETKHQALYSYFLVAVLGRFCGGAISASVITKISGR